MADKNLTKRIIEASQYLDAEHIARSLGVSIDIVKGVLSGDISSEVLDDYDPARPPEVRLVEKEKYVRSHTIGLLSFGGCGATTLAASLAVLSAEKEQALVVDLNEYAYIGSALGLGIESNDTAIRANISWWSDSENLESIIVQHPFFENLNIVLGTTTTARHNELTSQAMEHLIESASTNFSTVWVDCPLSPRIWKHVLPVLDIVLIVIRCDPVSLLSLWQAIPILRACGALEQCRVVLNFAGSGWLKTNECKNTVREIHENMNVIAVLPEESTLKRTSGECFVMSNPKSNYTKAVKSLLRKLTSGGEPKKGVLQSLANVFGF